MKKRILQAITALMLIMTLTMANFLLICANAVSYAADEFFAGQKTNHQNVEFAAYFKDKDGKEKSEEDAYTNSEDLKLYFRIAVKQEGMFNGTIAIKDANFKFVKNYSDNLISGVEDNKIYLNQINAGETKEIEVGIQLLEGTKFDLGLINKESKILLEGTYRDSTQKDIAISGERIVKANIVSPYNNAEDTINLSQKIITNEVVKYNGNNKRIIQLQVNSGINNNMFPIKTSLINVQIPKISDKYPEVQIGANKILATNGQMLKQENCTYNSETGLLTIQINNEPEDNNIIWTKNGDDKIIVTCIYDADVEINAEKFSSSSEISLYDMANTKVNAKSELQIDNEENDSIIEAEIVQNEENIYKGKLLAGVSRDITYTTIISSNLAGVVGEINLTEQNQKIGENKIASTYKNTVINKEQVISVLGESGELIILNSESNKEIAKINANSEVDENGNVIIDYPEGVSEIKIKTTSPKDMGDIKLTTTKTIGKVDKNMVKTATEMTTEITGDVIKNNNSKINLLDTETKAQLQLNKTSLSTMSTNSIEMRVLLNSRDENNDLYKNPTIRIQLPATVQNIDLKNVQLVDEEELKIQSAKILEGNVLEIKLSGEQTNYKDIAIEGTIVIINMDITLDRKAPSSQEQITLSCVNGEKVAQDSKAVDFVSYAGLVTINRVNGFNAEIINNQGNKEVTLPINQQNKATTVENEIINNEENEISDLGILGVFPTKDSVEGNNFDIAVGQIAVTGIDSSRVKVYYTENANATQDLSDLNNAWTENLTDAKNVKKYLIKVDKLGVKESIKASYDIQITQELEYNLVAKQGYTVYYTNVTAEKQVTTDYIEIKTEKGATLDVNLKALVASKEVSAVKEDEIIRYEATISNTGSEDISNAKIMAKVPENTVLVDSSKLNSTEQVEGDVESEEKSSELDEQQIEDSIDKIAQGETISKYYEVRVKKGTAGQTVQNNVQLQYGDVTKASNETNTTVEEGKLKVELTNGEESAVLKNGYSYRCLLTVSNESDKKISNAVVNVNNPEGIDITKILYISDDDYASADDTNTLTIKEINPGESVTAAIYYVTNVQTDKDYEDLSITAKVTANNKEYNSNELNVKVKDDTKGLDMTVNSENSGDYVKAGNKIKYNITVSNNGNTDVNDIEINSWIPNKVTLKGISRNGEELSEDEYDVENDDEKSGKLIVLSEDTIRAGENIKYVIEVITNVSYNDGEVFQIVNETSLKQSYKVVKTAKVEHILKTQEGITTDGNNGGNNDDNKNNGNTTNNTASKYLISGVAWVDENENGQKDSNEKLLEGIKVKLLDTKTNEYVKDSKGNALETTTNSEGFYSFTKISKGEYLVVFEYDTSIYGVTTFQKEGVSIENSSKVIEKNITIDGKEQKVGITEKIDLTKNVSGINIGFVPVKKYDMQLDKYVTKVTVQNSKTVSTDYTDAKLAKQEINAKEVNSTTVVVEYTIKVTNKGEVAGYVKKIADYLSTDYKFSSELNKDWYQDKDTVYCTSLSDVKINPGESKEVKLTVIKQMKENNTGLVNNTAEIVSSYNELGLTDINSSEGNKVKGENDMSSADVIISIKTGQVVTTVVLVITTVIILAAAIFIIKKSIINKGII